MGKRLGTSSADLTYGTIETIIIYNALLPICWAPINFVAAVTFIRFYRSRWNKGGKSNDEGPNGSESGNSPNSNANNEHEIGNIDKNNMDINKTKFLWDIGVKNYHQSFSMKWFGIQPSTMCLKIGSMDKYENDVICDIFNYQTNLITH